MVLYASNNFKVGLKILFEQQPCSIESVEFVKPGKGQVFSRVKLRKLLTGQLIEKTFRATDTLLRANVVDITLMYIYSDQKIWYFMNRSTFDQIGIDQNIMQDKYKWLVEQNDYVITLWNDRPISVLVSNFVNLQVISEVSSFSLDTVMSNNRKKLSKLSTGHIIQVPLFIKIGDVVKVDTRTGNYISRVNK
ncbi:elongation factor P [Buchnera aphidicola]|uniref:elongation factor P n=1 Tax=Buchnera aphidicola TaxID=9 RepID=UPI003463ACA8